ncbi:MAG: MaoC family dehydratase [Acidimicrobiales bacterium]
MAVHPAPTGPYFEDLSPGDVFEHAAGRTITEADNVWFSLLTQNPQAIHIDKHYAAQTTFGQPLVNSCFTLALVTGQSVADLTQNVLANLGWDEVKLPHPVFEGDTIYSRSEVLEARESASHPEAGIVTMRSTGYNQRGEVVISFKRTAMVYKRDHTPDRKRPTPQS